MISLGFVGGALYFQFVKGEDRSVLEKAWDRIYVTTLFSFEYPKISQTIDFALEVANGQADKVSLFADNLSIPTSFCYVRNTIKE